jgi:hypothetical protein
MFKMLLQVFRVIETNKDSLAYSFSTGHITDDHFIEPTGRDKIFLHDMQLAGYDSIT